MSIVWLIVAHLAVGRLLAFTANSVGDRIVNPGDVIIYEAFDRPSNGGIIRDARVIRVDPDTGSSTELVSGFYFDDNHGGIGVAPLHYLAEYFVNNDIHFDLLYGVSTSKDFILRKDLQRMSDKAIFVAEKGYKRRDTVVSAIKKIRLDDYGAAYTCGPKQMLIELQKLHLPVPVYALCEDFLGCGCGLCLGCAITYKGEYKRICVDGPIFELGEIDFAV